mmetsp:Transcript_4131/g.12027  ORF Transcript_4131/g.12027 Transcript_4131/m.12027 type:complete len:109 (-) Transcript_4131:927-1253(-)
MMDCIISVAEFFSLEKLEKQKASSQLLFGFTRTPTTARNGKNVLPALRAAQLLYPVVVIESADCASDHSVWNHSVSGLSVLWYVWDPKKSLCAWTKFAGRECLLYESK